LEVLEHTENTTLHAVRTNNPEVTPPILEIERKGPKRIEIDYRSKPNIPQLGVGVIKGIAEHYDKFSRLHISLSPLPGENEYLIAVSIMS
jgi:hypothetical protein